MLSTNVPDLIVSSVELVEGELSVCEDTSFKVEATVTNIGSADAVSTQISSHSGERYFQLDWYLVERSASSGEVLYKELIRGGRDQVYGAIAPGETRTESLSLSNGVEVAYKPRPAGGRAAPGVQERHNQHCPKRRDVALPQRDERFRTHRHKRHTVLPPAS